MAERVYRERTLKELGLRSTLTCNWNGVDQLQKPDFIDIIEPMIDNRQRTDVQVRINRESTTFNCHLLLLQCYSVFFMDITNERLVVLPPEKVTAEAFRKVYDWMLASKPKVQREGILELLTAAEFLGIEGLMEQIWACLDDHKLFSEDTAFFLYIEARKYELEPVRQLMLSRICKFFLTLVACREFVQLSAKEVCALLGSSSIGVNSETEVFMAAVRWLNFDWENREKYLIDVMKCIRFGLMTPLQITALQKAVSPELLQIAGCPTVKKMLQDSLAYVGTKYYFASNSENLDELLKRLHLEEPAERQWVTCEMFTDLFKCANNHLTPFKRFLKYLQMIKNIGKDHWKTLVSCDECPNLVLKRNISTCGDQKVMLSHFLALLRANKS